MRREKKKKRVQNARQPRLPAGRAARLTGIIVAAVAVTMAASWMLTPRQTPDSNQTPALPLPLASSSPFLNAAANVRYVGTQTCTECHTEEAATYHETAHRRAFADMDMDLATEPADGQFRHAASGREYRVRQHKGKVYHHEALRGADGRVLLDVEFPVRFLIGSGRHTRSYLVEDDGFLVQSPITWYAAANRWAMSPGYDTAHHWGFGRMVGTDCLTCHTGELDADSQQYRGIGIVEQAIGCERCHGPGSLHVERHRRGEAPAGKDLTIVHPAALSRSRLEAVCGQCHLQSAAMVRVRGRNFTDYRPGLRLEDFWIDYQQESGNDAMTVTGHVEQMRLSRCYQESASLTCTTCHALHAAAPEDKSAYYNQKCQQCHEPDHCGLARKQQPPPADCISCHMPTSAVEIPHVAFTHHRIGVHSDAAAKSEASSLVLTPIEDISHLPQIEQDRCLGLAYLQFSEQSESAEEASAARQKALDLLSSVYDDGLQDGEILAALAKLFVEANDDVAAELAAHALQSADTQTASRGEALFVLADIDFRRGRRKQAIARLNELVELRRVYEDWFLLGTCHYLEGASQLAIEKLEQAQHIDPFRPEVHQILSRCYAQLGQQDQAERHKMLEQALQEEIR